MSEESLVLGKEDSKHIHTRCWRRDLRKIILEMKYRLHQISQILSIVKILCEIGWTHKLPKPDEKSNRLIIEGPTNDFGLCWEADLDTKITQRGPFSWGLWRQNVSQHLSHLTFPGGINDLLFPGTNPKFHNGLCLVIKIELYSSNKLLLIKWYPLIIKSVKTVIQSWLYPEPTKSSICTFIFP